MWSFRTLFVLLSLAGCGFQPVNGPGGTGAALQGKVEIAEPETRDSFLLVQRLEERLGRSGTPEYQLSLSLNVTEQSLAINPEGDVERFNLIGQAEYSLRDVSTGEIALSGKVNNFTGYSATGTTVASLAAERDARRRLMTILGDQIVQRLQAGQL